jgi:hypothetical protein
VAKHKAEVAVQIFAHRLWLWKQDKRRADVNAVPSGRRLQNQGFEHMNHLVKRFS